MFQIIELDYAPFKLRAMINGFEKFIEIEKTFGADQINIDAWEDELNSKRVAYEHSLKSYTLKNAILENCAAVLFDVENDEILGKYKTVEDAVRDRDLEFIDLFTKVIIL